MTVTVSGIAKGVGMIHPKMATMLSVVLTDAAVEPAVLWGLLRPAAARTWDQLSVDGDTSTNDTVFVLASGASAAAPVGAESDAAATLGAAIEAVARDLARQQAADGEGATTLITADGPRRGRRRRRPGPSPGGRQLQPGQGRGPRQGPELGPDRGCRRERDAGECRRPRGGRPVPGRGGRRAGRPRASIPTACGSRSPVTSCSTVPRAARSPSIATAARAAMDAPELVIGLDLGLGDGRGEAFGCDLTEAYVHRKQRVHDVSRRGRLPASSGKAIASTGASAP